MYYSTHFEGLEVSGGEYEPMEKNTDSKRKSRNLSEKKRRDQFNNLINELNNLIDPHFNQHQNDAADDQDDACSSSAAAARQRKMDKSSVLKCAMEFLKKHSNPQGQQQQQQQLQHQDDKSQSVYKPHFQGDDYDSGCEAKSSLDKSQWKPSYITDDEFSVQMLEALDAFILVCEVTPEARIIYSSDTLTNLLSYSGTCNSLRHYDYVSMFDLVSSNDRQQLEKLFAEESDVTNQENSSMASKSKGTAQQNNNRRDCLQNELGYKSLVVNFRSGLNLTDIKQKHLRQKGVVLRPSPQNQSYQSLDHQMGQYQAPAPVEQMSQQQLQMAKQQQQPQQLQQYQRQQQQQQEPQHHSQLRQQSMDQSQQEQQSAGDFYIETVDEQEKACGRGQHSIAEQQQQLISEGHREQQEQNQHRQQLQRDQNDGTGQRQTQQQQEEAQQQHQQQLADLLQIDKQSSDEIQMSDGSNENNSGDDGQQQASSTPPSDSASATNSDENDQPSSTGSDDASESNQSQSVTGERKHQYRHHHHHHHHSHHHHNHSHHHHHHKHQHSQPHRHHHHHHHHHHHNSGSSNAKSLPHQRRQKSTSQSNGGQQYELVRLMGIVKSFGDSPVGGLTDGSSGGANEFEGQQHHTAKSQAKKRYFICIGRLDTPRLSYDLKMIAPPMTSGTNVFHNNQFLSKHTLKWRFLWVDNRAPAIIGYLPFEVLGTSGYDYYHWDDLDKLVSSHEGLMRDGQGCSGPYRFLTKGQQWIWLQTKYCIILKPQCYSGQQQQRGIDDGKAAAANQKRPKLLTQNNDDKRQQQQQQMQQQQQSMYRDTMSLESGGANRMDYMDHHQQAMSYDYENQPNYHLQQQQQQQTGGYMSTTMLTYNPNQMSAYHADGPLNHQQFGATVSHQQQQFGVGGEQITYSMRTTSSNFESEPKRFRSEQYDSSMSAGRMSTLKSSSSGNIETMQEEEEEEGCDNNSSNINGANMDEGQQHKQLFCDQQQNEQRRYEKLLKTNDLIKKQSIEAGNSFLSRSLDQFKFILCTHTVIGFDESDGDGAAGNPSGPASAAPIKAKMVDHQQQQQQQQQQQPQPHKTFGTQSRVDKREQLQQQRQSKSLQSISVGAFQQQPQKSQ